MPLPRIRYRAASVTNGETVEAAIRQRGGLAADRLAARAQHDAQAQFVSAPKRAAAALDASPGRQQRVVVQIRDNAFDESEIVTVSKYKLAIALLARLSSCAAMPGWSS